ncbi:MAG: hypothetical protein LBF41_06165 [Deltaproteobacteria bacterium]|jgi:hypothetical protein|nr:hypothetical protein [Deltaproteobacteria bacterium]
MRTIYGAGYKKCEEKLLIKFAASHLELGTPAEDIIAILSRMPRERVTELIEKIKKEGG